MNKVYSFDESKNQTFVNAYNNFYPQIKYFSWHFLKDKDAAETVTQNAFLRLGTSKQLHNSKQKVKKYLYTITWSACYEQLYNNHPKQTRLKNLEREHSTENLHTHLIQEEAATFNELLNILRLHDCPYENSMLDKKSISSLLVNYVSRLATDDDIIMLEEWASLSVENRNLLNRFNNFNFIITRLGRMEQIYKDANVNDCLQRLNNYLKAKEVKAKRILLNTSAAAILILFFLAHWLYNHRFSDVKPKQSVAKIIASTNSLTVRNPSNPTSSSLNGTLNNNNCSQKKGGQRNAINRLPGHVAQLLVKEEDLEQPDAQFTLRESPYAWPVTGPRLKKHQIITKDKTVLHNLLPDGSSFTLNAESQIVYPDRFDSLIRKTMINGEAYFSIIQNAALPFLVAANGVHIEANGGTFNVRSYLNEKQTVVSVLTADSLTVSAGPYQTMLREGETAIIKKGPPIEVYKTINAQKIVAYKDLIFNFDNDNLNEVAWEIARWYSLTLVIKDTTNTLVTFQGSRTMKVADVIKNLVASDGQCHATLKGTELIIH
ncbi:FecR domain-containing protein [Longitalea luteola]|uniref:FecR domain-containing protein n=1 Tax=Longitalea luteola TaxID=2812563 RepID=UPI001A965237